MMAQKKAISLFAGAGGDTLGLQNSGIDVIGFIEYDDDAIKTHTENFPNCKLIGKDICDIKDETLIEYKNKNIDFLFGGFPCQSFSHGGKKKANDPRGQLYKQFIRVTNLIKPKIIIGENVKGILTRKMENDSLFVDNIINEFKEIGYSIKYKLIECEKFGVPQMRKRVIFIGTDDNINFNFTDLNWIISTDELKNIRNIIEPILENAIIVEKSKFIDMIPENKISIIPDDMKIEITGNPPTNLLKCYNETKSKKNSDFNLSFKKRKGGNYSCIVDIDNPVCTILCTYNRMPRLFVCLKYLNNIYFRPFTVNELKQIQGFPKEFVFYGNTNSIIKQIGNAVPPIVITNIITKIQTFM